MIKLTLVQDLETDANNWYEAINPNETKNYGFDRKTQARPEDKPTVEKIFGKTKKEAFEILLPYLEEKYKKPECLLSDKKHLTECFLEQNKDILFGRITEITKHPIRYDEIKLFITTYARCPYNREKGYIRLNINASHERMLNIVAHEILHFQFHTYYSDYPKVKLLDPEQYYLLKESLTFLLNHEFKDILKEKDYGYPLHQKLRKQLEDYRLSQPENERDFEKLIDYGCDILLHLAS